MPRLPAFLLVLTLAILPAGAADLRIQGLQEIQDRRAQRMLEPFLPFIQARPATPARARDAAFFLRLVLLRDGFVNPQVRWTIVAPDTILLSVEEGIRLTLGEIEIRGVADEDLRDALVDAFESPASQRATGFGTGLPFLPEDLEPALDSVVTEFESRGYWEGRVRVARRWVTPGNHEVNFVLHAIPGPQFQLGPPVIRGIPAGDAAEISARLEPLRGRVADSEAIEDTRDIAREYFHARGYPFVEVLLDSVRDGNIYRVVLNIEPGRRHHIGSIRLLGLERTNPRRVAARFADLPGEFYDYEEFNEPLLALHGTGAFEEIRTERVFREDGGVDFTLHFTEGRPKSIGAYLGAANFEGYIIGATYSDRNFLHHLLRLNLTAEITSRGLLGQASLTDPWLFETDTHAAVRLFGLTRDYDGYDTDQGGVSATLTWEPTAHYEIALTAGASHVDIHPDGIRPPQLGETEYQHYFLRLTQRFEYRDQPLMPTRGFYGEITAEAAAARGDETITYLRATGRASYHIPVREDHRISLGLRTGILIPSRGGDAFPIDLRFFQGGHDTVRSFQERRLGPRAASGDPLGGEAFWTANAEYAHQIIGPLMGIAFADIGSLGRSYKDYGFSNIQVALGGGLRLELPISPVRLEYGHNLTHDSGGPSGTLHFAFGLAF